MANNFERMMELVDEVFDVKNDPGQLSVNNYVLRKLQQMHPACLTDYIDGDGPIAWILTIPTLEPLMQEFIAGKLTEQQLFDQTPVDAPYDVVYLCSASILEEYRKKGLGKRLTTGAVQAMQQQFTIKALFYWPFPTEGDRLAASVARELSLPLYRKEDAPTGPTL